MYSLIAFVVAYVLAAAAVLFMSKTRLRRLFLALARLALIIAAVGLMILFFLSYKPDAYSRILAEATGEIPFEAYTTLLGLLAGNLLPVTWKAAK